MPQLTHTPVPMLLDTTTTAGKLMAVGEQMIGRRGFGVAMHEIAQEAQQANKYAVQYHFGHRDGLVGAIFAARARLIFARRAELLDAARRARKLRNVAALLEIIYLPIAEQVDPLGHHSFARFWLQYHARPEAGGLHHHPFGDDVAQYQAIVEKLAAALRLDIGLVAHQLQLLGWIFFASLIDRESREEAAAPTLFDVIDNAIALAAPALAKFDRSLREIKAGTAHMQ